MKQKLINAFSDIDERYILEAKPNKRNRKVWISTVAAVIVICLISTAVAVPLLKNREHTEGTGKPEPDKEGYIGTSSNETAVLVPKWDEMEVTDQFFEVSDGKNRYSSSNKVLTQGEIGEFISSASSKGYDVYTEKEYMIKARLYKIPEISSECAVAVAFEGHEGYFVYTNHLYKPRSLFQFLNDLNLREEIKFNTAYMTEVTSEGILDSKFYGAEKKAVMEILFSDDAVAHEDFDSVRFVDWVGFSVDVEVLGHKNISIWVTKDGWLATNILATGKAFYIGEERLAELVKYLNENCERSDSFQKFGSTEQTDSTEETGQGQSTPSYDPNE